MYCPLMMGLGLLAFAVYCWVQVDLLRHNGQKVTAEVIGKPGGPIHRGKKARQEITYELIVRYRPPDEEPLELRVATRNGASFEHGQRIQVIYNPAKPEARAILPEENLSVGPLLVFILGLIVTCFGLYPLF
jgi:hypothetical protein